MINKCTLQQWFHRLVEVLTETNYNSKGCLRDTILIEWRETCHASLASNDKWSPNRMSVVHRLCFKLSFMKLASWPFYGQTDVTGIWGQKYLAKATIPLLKQSFFTNDHTKIALLFVVCLRTNCLRTTLIICVAPVYKKPNKLAAISLWPLSAYNKHTS